MGTFHRAAMVLAIALVVIGAFERHSRAQADCSTILCIDSTWDPIFPTSGGPEPDGHAPEIILFVSPGVSDGRKAAYIATDQLGYDGPWADAPPTSGTSSPFDVHGDEYLAGVAAAGHLAGVDLQLHLLPTGPNNIPTAQGGRSTVGPTGAGSTGNSEVSDPVDPVTGEFILRDVDLELPSFGIHIRVVRTYRSRVDYDGPLGPGWDHSFNQRLFSAPADPDGVPVSPRYPRLPVGFGVIPEMVEGELTEVGCGPALLLSTGEGTNIRFHETSSTGGTILYTSAVAHLTLVGTEGPAGPTWTLRTPHGDTRHFDVDGRLAAWRDANGVGLTLQWTGSGDDARVTSILDSSERLVLFTYDPAGHLVRVGEDSSELEATYSYATNGTLVDVLRADGRGESYEYDIDLSREDDDWIPEGQLQAGCALACAMPDGTCEPGGACKAPVDEAMTQCLAYVAPGGGCMNECTSGCRELCEGSCEALCGAAAPQEAIQEDCLAFFHEGDPDDPADATPFESCDECTDRCHSDAMFLCGAWSAEPPTMSEGEFDACVANIESCCSYGIGCADDSCHPGNCKFACMDGFMTGNSAASDCDTSCQLSGTCSRPQGCQAIMTASCVDDCEQECAAPTCIPACEQESCTEAACEALQFDVECETACTAACVEEGRDGQPRRYGHMADLNYNIVRVYDGAGRLYLTNTYGANQQSPDFDAVIAQDFAQFHPTFARRDLLADSWPGAPAWAHGLIDDRDDFVPVDICPFTCEASPIYGDIMVPLDGTLLDFSQTTVQVPVDGFLVDRTLTSFVKPTLVTLSRNGSGAVVGRIERRTSSTNYFATTAVSLPITLPGGGLVTLTTSASGNVSVSGTTTVKDQLLAMRQLTLFTDSAKRVKAYPGAPVEILGVASGSCTKPFEVVPVSESEMRTVPVDACQGELWLTPIAGVHPVAAEAANFPRDGVSALHTTAFHSTTLSPGPNGYVWRHGIDGRRTREEAPSGAGRTAAAAAVNALYTQYPMFSTPTVASAAEPLYVFHYAPYNVSNVTPLPAPSDAIHLGNVVVQPGGPLQCDPTVPHSAMHGSGAMPTQAAAVVDFHGARWTYYADDRNNVLRTLNHETGATWSFNYDPAGHLTAVEMPDGARTCAFYDDHGNLSRRLDLPAATEGVSRPSPVNQYYRYHSANAELTWVSDPRTSEPARPLYTITRNSEGNPTAFAEADGTTTTVQLDGTASSSHGQILSLTAPGLVSTSFTYGPSGLPNSVSVQGNGTPIRSMQYEHDEHGRLVWESTPEGLTTTHSYDGPRLAFINWEGDGVSGRQTLGYDDDGQVDSFVAGTPGSERIRIELAHDMTGAVIEVKRTALDGSAAPSVECRKMAPGGRVLETVSGEGIRTRYQYDGEGRVLSIEAGDLGPSPGSWDDHCLAHPTGGSEHFVLATYEYDIAGRLIESTDERGRVTTTKRDGFGRPVIVSRPDGTQLRLGYDAMNNVTWQAVYTTAGAPAYRRPSWSDAALRSASEYFYDARGRLGEIKAWHFEEAQAPVGDGYASTTFAYDDAQHTVTRTDDAGNQWTTRDDGAGRVLEERAPGGLAKTYSFPSNRTVRVGVPIPAGTLESELALTSWGQVSSTSLRIGSTNYPVTATAFDEMLRPTVTTSLVTGAQSITDYDAFGRVKTQRGIVPSGTGETVSLVYDRDGNPTARVSSTTDAMTASWAWRYDALGREVRATDPTGAATTTSYVLGSRLPSVVTDPRNVQLQHTWGTTTNSLALTAVDPAGPDVTMSYAWDGLGHLVSATRADESLAPITNTFAYDSLGDITSETDNQLPPTWARTHRYDGRGLRTSTTVNGASWTREYDALGRLGAVKYGAESTALATYTYAGFDYRTKRRSQNGIETSYTYDALGRLIWQNEQNLATNQSVATWGWVLPLDGVTRRANLRRGTSGTDNAVFRVDGALRMVSEDSTSASTFTLTPTTSWGSANQAAAAATTSAAWQYVLDGRSSWTRRTKGAVPTTYTRDAGDALRAIDSQVVTVDARGAYKTDGTLTVAYDAVGLVKTVAQPGLARAYRRDALGRVVTETDQASAVTRYAYDGASRILRQRPSGTVDVTVDGELDEHIVNIEGSTRRFLHQDRRGSVFLTTSSVGAPLEWIKYTAYGEASITSSSISTQFGFNGLPHDFAIGLVDMRARVYRPTIGRFLTPDPLGLVDGSNRFAFVAGSPLSHRDPFGLSREEATEPDPDQVWLQETYGNVIAERHRSDWRAREEARLAERAAKEVERIRQNEEAIAYMTAAHDFTAVALAAGPVGGAVLVALPVGVAIGQSMVAGTVNALANSAAAYLGTSFVYGVMTPPGSPDFPGFGDDMGRGLRGISSTSTVDDTVRGSSQAAHSVSVGNNPGGPVSAPQGPSVTAAPSPSAGVPTTGGGGGGSSPTFIGQASGPSIIVPAGGAGPVPALSGKGVQYTSGTGGAGLSSRVTSVRIMEPTAPGGASPGYPNGYATYMNAAGQTVNPYTGQTIAKTDWWWHIPLD